MKKFTATQISHLYRALLIAGVLLNLCVAPTAPFGHKQPQQEAQSFAGVASGAHSQALTTAPRPHTEIPASKQKRVRHPALDFTALAPESFQLSSLSFSERALDRHRFAFRSSFSVQPQGRAPPVSV
jgi:hypothetical protein